jgi:N-acetylmuramoyl-L-alanine amidase
MKVFFPHHFSLLRLVLLWMAVLCSPGSYAADVQGMRIYRSPDSTRLVFDLSSAVEHRIEVLPPTADKPERLLIELKNTAMKGDGSPLDLQDTPITQIRFGQHNDFDLWTVLDLKARVTPKIFLLKPMGQYGNRLVVDLYDQVPAPVPAVVEQAPTTPPSAVPGQPPAPPSPLRNILIVIDAGHGGEDPGAMGPNRLREKDITLQIAKELQAVINVQPGYRAELTRKGDYFIPLEGRSKIAADKKADLFVSIHADAFTNKRAAGASVFAWSQRGATSTTAKFLADSENLSDLVGGADPAAVDNTFAQVLADLSIDGVVNYSLGMGTDILREIGGITHLHKRHVEQAGFMVLKSVRVPSLLIETGFISNPDEAKRLSSQQYQQQLARAIFSGINRYFTRVPPPDTYIAAQQAGKPVVYTPEPSLPYVAENKAPSAKPVVKKPEVKRTIIHTVKRGETLSGISAKYNVTVTALKKHNKLKSSTVYVGQKLKIPT